MEITTTSTNNTSASNATTNIKTPEAETETPTRIQPLKPLSFTNGVLKRHHPLHHHYHHQPPIVVIYKECLKNHAASLGGHALDGCGEFMPSPSATPTDPTSLKCAACGCHRNFHRREPDYSHPATPNKAVIEYQPHHRHHPPPPRAGSPNSPSPPPISSSYYPASAPHMLLALSAGLQGPQTEHSPTVGRTTAPISAHPNGRKRFRTKFTQNQKERMFEFAERVEWKIQRRDEVAIAEFCGEIGVDRGVLKVWMHNNKSTFGKRDNIPNANGSTTYNTTNSDNTLENNNSSGSRENYNQLHNSDSVGPPHNVVATNGNGSSSSS